jgi:deferrochelatase/peroxidase EfeB
MSTGDEKGVKPSRRLFLAAAGGLVGSTGAPQMVMANPQLVPPLPERELDGGEPFYGRHQSGITTPMQSALYFASFDLATDKRSDVVGLLQAWTTAAARLTSGLPAVAGKQDEHQPGLDSGEAIGLGRSRLTLTFGFGPDLFVLNGHDRYGLNARRPAALAELPSFSGDQLVDGHCGGALCIQACADDPQVAFHAVRQLARISYGAATLKWVQSGFSTASETKGTPRNLMGFKDGTINPDAGSVDDIVWAGAEGPDWMQQGSYMVARRIRIALEHWDRMNIAFQEKTIGRKKLSGAPLGGKHEFDTPDFQATDAGGDFVIPETAHIRLAAPATNNRVKILRRSYSYNDGANFTAERWPPWRQGIEYDSGLFFVAYQRDPRTGFIALFDKMSKIDALNQFTTHVGSAVFACPPGLKNGEYIGQRLFQS